MSTNIKEALARRFLSVLGHPDAEVVKSVSTDDVVWSLPGAASISGEARGVDGIMQRARTIASYGVKVEILDDVDGFSGVAMILHNTGKKDDRTLDEHLAAAFSFRGDTITRLDTYLSDVPMMERFLAWPCFATRRWREINRRSRLSAARGEASRQLPREVLASKGGSAYTVLGLRYYYISANYADGRRNFELRRLSSFPHRVLCRSISLQNPTDPWCDSRRSPKFVRA
jgi:ketosteroid isomerase-like protein